MKNVPVTPRRGEGCDGIDEDTIFFQWGKADKCCEAVIAFFGMFCIVTLFPRKEIITYICSPGDECGP